jgi:poly-gamma-glutamate synthesis protein (capsule biosynthesis protein)
VLPAAATLLVVAVTGVALAFTQGSPTARPDPTTPTITGIVVGETGAPIPGAAVWLDTARATTDANGRFAIAHDGPAVVRASAPGHLPRTTAVGAGEQGRITLTGQAAETVSMRFGGDVMFGRRYYTGSENTPRVLRDDASSDDIARVLSGVQPFLDDADLTVVNLETALVATPWTDVDGHRPISVHPTKDLVITSSTRSARALAASGVDVVSLSNNHSYDGLDAGISSTLSALDAAGVLHYGAGRTVDEAWRPAVVEVKGQRIAFVGCTTIDGRAHLVSYVAEGKHGGAAACDPTRLAATVRSARKQAAYVVVSIHGGVEYRRSQTADVRALANVAHAAGARLVVGSHPHVVGGIVHTGDDLFIESMGNLAFDQEMWATLPSYLARVDVRDGATVAADLDPVVLDAYRPRPATGLLAATIGRMAAGWVDGGALLDDSKATVPFDGAAGRTTSPVPPQASSAVKLAAGDVRRLAPGWWLAPASDLPGRVRAGNDRLFGTGGFEAEVVGSQDAAPLWLIGKFGAVTADASCVPSGGRGLLLARSPLSQETAFATTRHRVPAAQRETLTLSAKVRYASPGSRLEVHWYDDFTGPSTSTSKFDIPTGVWDRSTCARLRFDVVAPAQAVAAQVFVVLDAPQGGQVLRHLAVDDLMLIGWAPQGRSGRRYDVVKGLATGTVALRSDYPTTAPSSPLDP